MSPLIIVLIQELVIPEIRHLLEKNPSITDAEIIAAVGPLADRIISNGEKFLAAKGQPDQP